MRKALTACAIACLLPAVAKSAEVIVTGPHSMLAPLRELVVPWEDDTGHRVVWLEGADYAEAADLIVSDVATARRLDFDGMLAPMQLPEDPEDWMPPPLLSQTLSQVRSDVPVLLALPVDFRIPTLRAHSELLAKAALTLSSNPSWQEVFDLAYGADDPVGNVHGLCVAEVGHATMVRSLLVDQGSQWLSEPSNMPYEGVEWLKQAERYARALARFGPANAARLSSSELKSLRSQDRCAIWLAFPGEKIAEGDQVATIPGAAAFTSIDLSVVALAADSERESIARSLAWWLSENALGNKTLTSAEEEFAALNQDGSAEQPTTVDPPGIFSWRDVDLAGEASLRELIDGLISVADALAKAGAALADNG